jgi:hypothetical protein
MTTHARNRRVGVPAYYLGRPADFWRTALAPRPAASQPLTPDRSSSAEPSAHRVADRGTL